MAKLSARGRTEMVRMSKEESINNSDLISWQKTTVTLMSDGHYLTKREVMFKPDIFNPSGYRHNYGWKDHGKTKVLAERFKATYKARGYCQSK